ncbi:MAG: MaoC/PaaZ C-terminal domain-containing protein, partial [Pseudomonadota bacterium]
MQGSRGYFLEDLETGMVERFAKTVTEADIVLYAGITGDTNPLHLDQDYAETTMFKGR